MSFSPPPTQPVPVAPDAPAPPPVFGQNPTSSKPAKKSMTPSFLGQQDTPRPQQLGTKTLLGQ